MLAAALTSLSTITAGSAKPYLPPWMQSRTHFDDARPLGSRPSERDTRRTTPYTHIHTAHRKKKAAGRTHNKLVVIKGPNISYGQHTERATSMAQTKINKL